MAGPGLGSLPCRIDKKNSGHNSRINITVVFERVCDDKADGITAKSSVIQTAVFLSSS